MVRTSVDFPDESASLLRARFSEWQIAMRAAEDDVNSDPSILGGSKLSILMHDSNFSGFLGIVGGKLFYYLFRTYFLPVLILAVPLFFLIWSIFLSFFGGFA